MPPTRRDPRRTLLSLLVVLAILSLCPIPAACADDDAARQATADAAAPPGTPSPTDDATARIAQRFAPPAPAEGQDETLQQRIDRWNTVRWNDLLETDPLAFLRLLRLRVRDTVEDFTASFHKQERIRGKLRDEEVAKMKFRADPFSVYMKYTKGDRGREVLYVDGKYENKMHVHPGGILGAFVKLHIEPDGDMALKDNQRPVTRAGIPNILETLVPQFDLAKANGELGVEYLGIMDIAGRKVHAIKRILPKRDIYASKELVLYIDVERLIPLGTDAYTWQNQLLSKYRYTNVKLNVGLTDHDFDKDNKDYHF